MAAALCSLPVLLLLLLPTLSPALNALPEVFKSFPISHVNLSSLAATALATSNTGDVYIAGTADPLIRRATHRVSKRHRHVSLSPPLIFLARISPIGSPIWLRTLRTTAPSSVSALALLKNHVFVAGSTAGTVANATRTTAPGSTSIFFSKHTTATGDLAWPSPRLISTASDDVACALVTDPKHYFPHLYLSGRLGAPLFEPAVPQAGATVVRKATPPTDDVATTANATDTDADAFVACVDPDTGDLLTAVRLPLDRDNSADALAVHGDTVYAVVNSFDNAPLDPQGRTALYAFRATDLTYRPLHADMGYDAPGDFIQAMAADAAGSLYLAGFSLRGGRMADGAYMLRKFSVEKGKFVWQKELGSHSKVEPKVSVAVGRATGNVFVSGHAAGVFRRARQAGHPDNGEMLSMPLTVFSTDGRELISWDRTTPYPVGYEEISAIALDKNENVIYTGKWLNPKDELYDAIVGSFGASSFTARAAETEAEGIIAGDGKEAGGGGMGASTIGLICLAVGVGLIAIGFAGVMGRGRYLGNKGLVYGASYDTDADDDDEANPDEALDRMERTGFASWSPSDEILKDAELKASNDPKDVGGSSGPC